MVVVVVVVVLVVMVVVSERKSATVVVVWFEHGWVGLPLAERVSFDHRRNDAHEPTVYRDTRSLIDLLFLLLMEGMMILMVVVRIIILINGVCWRGLGVERSSRLCLCRVSMKSWKC